MPANISLFIDVANNRLLAGQFSSQIAPSLPTLFYGDTVSLQIYLLQAIQSSTANNQLPSYATFPSAALTLYFYLDNGIASPTIYTQQLVWTLSSDGTNFAANVSLFTAALTTLMGSSPTAGCYLQIGYIQNGLPTTVFSNPITLKVGIPPAGAPVVPAGLTALSLEVANTLFVPINGKPNGQPFFQTTPAGHTFVYQAVDNPDGTASPTTSQIN
jgi:hypothetical protein